MATLNSEKGKIFENVEFVEPPQQCMEQPHHPLAQRHCVNNRKRKEHPSQNPTDEPFATQPPFKRLKTNQNTSKWRKFQPTIQEMESHSLFKLAKQNWLKSDQIAFDSSLVSQLYFEHIASQQTDSKHNVMILEFSQYLEKYLWKFFDFKVSSDEHILSIIYFINKKSEQRTPVWSILMDTKYHTLGQKSDTIQNSKDNRNKNMYKLSLLFDRIFAMKLDEIDLYLGATQEAEQHHNDNNNSRVWNQHEKGQFLLFLIHCFYTMENESVRVQILKLVGLPLFQHLDDKQRQKIFVFVPSLAHSWTKYMKNKSKIPRYQQHLYWLLFQEFFIILKETESLYKLLKDTNTSNGRNNANLNTLNTEYMHNLNYIYNFCQLIVDNLCILMTRRYLRPLLQSSNILFLIQCKYLVSPLLYENDVLFNTMIQKVAFYLNFEVDDFDGRSLNDNEMRLESNHKLMVLQKCVYKYFYDRLKPMALCTISSLDDYEKLKEYLSVLDTKSLYTLCDKLHIMPQNKYHDIQQLLSRNEINRKQNITEREILIEILTTHHLSRESKREQIAHLSLYPTEQILFDDKALFMENMNDKYNVLGLDKLNLQFLSIYDYLLRNYNLYRLESAHSIRDDIAKAIWKIRPRLKRNSNTKIKDTVFTGYSRYALPVDDFSIASVHKPHLGETKPSQVIAEIAVDLKIFHDSIYSEWEDLRENDVLFLVRLKAVLDIDIEDDTAYKKQNEFGVGNKRWDELSINELGIQCVRGCHIVSVRDGKNPQHVINEYDLETGEQYKASGSKRIYDVAFDCAQYQLDIESMVEHENKGDIYSYFNLLIRRKGKENNFKAVLHSITSLMTHSNNINVYHDRSQTTNASECLLPKWFEPLFLGFGSPKSAAYYHIHRSIAPPNIMSVDDIAAMPQKYRNMVKDYYCLDFKYCFLDLQHIKHSFAGKTVKILDVEGMIHKKDDDCKAPYKIWFSKQNIKKPNYEHILDESLRQNRTEDDNDANSEDIIYVQPYLDTKQNEFVVENIKRNEIRFTPIQIEAIKAGMHHGLTMVVGPPGSGKTDVAVQIISNLYANFGETERILLVTHSNMALNDLFEKLMLRDIDQRYLLRLGFGYKKLQERNENHLDFSRSGRIDFMLNDRLNKLQIAQLLAKTLGLTEKSGYCHTAETCANFKNMKLMNFWEDFEDELDAFEDRFADKLTQNDYIITEYASVHDANKVYRNIAMNDIINTIFPFNTFIKEILSTLQSDSVSVFMSNESYSFNKSLAYQYWSYILSIFKDLAQCHVFELLRTTKDRSQYLLTRQSKIVAMTVTHAAIKRDEFIKHKFEYDTLIMEEAAQILDIETFIPMVLQKNNKRLKRIILIGDHHQLPPIIKNKTFAGYSKLDESLFHRLIRLEAPYHLLNMQGRCRSHIRSLWSWNYPYNMGDLQCVLNHKQYKSANAGFYYDYQLITVDHFIGNGEFQPNPYFYQNIDEAEYVVNCYMFMRLIGYPSDKITILTTYNGQKQLIKEILKKKCVADPLFGAPHKISTVDQYQGSQNDFVLLSLVRTHSVGHLRDVRRLIVALSRAKYGLYIFAHSNLFRQYFELKEAFNLLLKRPTQLRLVTNESYPALRPLDTTLNAADFSQDDEENVGSKTSKYFDVENISHFMHIVNRMSDSVRNHFKHEYQQQLHQYKEKVHRALEEKRKNDRKQKEEESAKKKVENEDVKKDDDTQDVEMIEMKNDESGEKQKGLNSKEQFDLAAEMALIRSNQCIDNEDVEHEYDDIANNENDGANNTNTKDNDSSIEYESSSSEDD